MDFPRHLIEQVNFIALSTSSYKIKYNLSLHNLQLMGTSPQLYGHRRLFFHTDLCEVQKKPSIAPALLCYKSKPITYFYSKPGSDQTLVSG